jgi:hypothetical protein
VVFVVIVESVKTALLIDTVLVQRVRIPLFPESFPSDNIHREQRNNLQVFLSQADEYNREGWRLPVFRAPAPTVAYCAQMCEASRYIRTAGADTRNIKSVGRGRCPKHQVGWLGQMPKRQIGWHGAAEHRQLEATTFREGA